MLLTCIFHSTVLNQSPCAFHFLKIFYFVEILYKNGRNLKPLNLKTIDIWKRSHSANKYMFKFHNRSTRGRWKVCSKLTIKTPERGDWSRSDVFIVNVTFFTCYSSASILDFEQVNISKEPVLWISIYPRAEADIGLLPLLLTLLFYC